MTDQDPQRRVLWCNAYTAALSSALPDPASSADAAVAAYDLRFQHNPLDLDNLLEGDLTPADAALLPTEQEIIDGTANAGIPNAFASLVYNDWLDMGGKNGGNRDILPKDLPGHVRKRWRYEQMEWRLGTHKGLSVTRKSQKTGPSRKEVNEYAQDKGDGAIQYAIGWWDYWEKREWKWDGHLIDWKVMFSKMWAKKRA